MGFLTRHSLELQFWGYETGNIVAAIAGAGGFSHLAHSLQQAFAVGTGPLGDLQSLVLLFPEAAATLGVVALVVFAFPVAALARWLGCAHCAELVHAAAVPLAFALLIFAVIVTASPFTVAACAFVAGSCLLRGAGSFPILLKLGGLCLALGGVGLGAAALTVPMGNLAETGLAVSTFLAGIYVAGAGLLTYRGGLFVIAQGARMPAADTPIASLLHPTDGVLARILAGGPDAVVERICTGVVLPSIFWASDETKASRPFHLSMVARLPWRVIATGFALASGTEIGLALALANIFWALGDIAIGALDAPDRVAVAPAASEGGDEL